jgi:hypothetical protein
MRIEGWVILSPIRLLWELAFRSDAMQRKGSRRDPGKEQAWRAVLDRQRCSGLSIRAFCRRDAISQVSFYAWRRELVRRDREAPRTRPEARRPDAMTTFIPMLLKPQSVDVDRVPDVRRVLEVTWSDGSRVRAWPGCDAALLQAALRGLLSAAQVGGQSEVASC